MKGKTVVLKRGAYPEEAAGAAASPHLCQEGKRGQAVP